MSLVHTSRQPPTGAAWSPSRDGTLRHEWLMLAGILLIGLVVRFAVAPLRWVNADEGAHLMDGRLVLDGLVPNVDFQSRQVLYVYVMALAVRVLDSIVGVRMLSALLAVGCGGFIHLIARRLFDARVGLLACALFLLGPYAIAMSTHAKTGPLTLFLSVLAVYLFVRGRSRHGNAIWLVAAGATVALCFYVRQSSLAVFAALIVSAAVLDRRSAGRLARESGAVAAGFMAVWLVVFAAFLLLVPAGQVRDSTLNPAQFVTEHVLGVVDAVRGRSPVQPDPDMPATAEVFRRSAQTWADTRWNVVEAVRLNAGLAFAGLIAPLLLLAAPFRTRCREWRRSLAPVSTWLAMLALAYGYYAIKRGFFFAYFQEFLPPLAISAGILLVLALDALGRPWQDAMLLIGGLIAYFLAERFLPIPVLYRPFYFVLPAFALAFWLLRTTGEPGRWARAASVIAVLTAAAVLIGEATAHAVKFALYIGLIPAVLLVLLHAARVRATVGRDRALAFAALALTVAVTIDALRFSADRVRVDYDGSWPPEVIEQVARYVRSNSEPTEEVLSGAVIWAFEADRDPFMRISHPLGLRAGIPPGQRTAMEAYLLENPPRFIILDGFTEPTYLRHLPGLEALLAARYALGFTADAGRYPVQVYRLGDPGRSSR